jgi:hypothetical protein
VAALPSRPRSTAEAEIVARGHLGDEDLQIALHICYGLHYDGFAGVDDEWEWDPGLLAVRSRIEHAFLADLIGIDAARPALSHREVTAAFDELLGSDGGPSLSSYLLERGTLAQLREFVVHRSIYQRKEADPHTWVIPRLRGRAKSACVRLQSDEYGNGEPGRTHAELFATTMREFGLDPTPGAYVDQVPATTLATDNLVSLLGLHRRWRGALVGHLAAFEMTSVVPMARYAEAIRRRLPSAPAAEFYECHVVADTVHERIAAEELLRGLVDADPEASRDVCVGAAALLAVERRFATHLLTAWSEGTSSLRTASAGQPRAVHPHHGGDRRERARIVA